MFTSATRYRWRRAHGDGGVLSLVIWMLRWYKEQEDQWREHLALNSESQHDITSIWQETTCCSNKCYHNRTPRPRLGLAPQADGDWRTLNLLSRRHSSLFSSSVGVFRFVLEVLMPYTCTFYRHTNHQNSLQAKSTSASMPRLQLAHTGSYNWPRLIVVNRTDTIKIPKLETLVMQCVYLTILVNTRHSHS